MNLSAKLSENIFIKYAFLKNVWISAHMFEGLIAAKLMEWSWLLANLGLSPIFFTGRPLSHALPVLLIVALSWEVIFEPLIETAKYGDDWMAIIYKKNSEVTSYQHWLYDSIGDVLGFVIIGMGVIT